MEAGRPSCVFCPQLEHRTAVVYRFALPWPPSVNDYYRSPNKGPLAGRTLLTGRARKYRMAAMVAMREQRVWNRIGGRLAVRLIIDPPDHRKRDLDNLFKPVLDALQHGGAIVDDCLIKDLSAVEGEVTKGGRVTVLIGIMGGIA